MQADLLVSAPQRLLPSNASIPASVASPEAPFSSILQDAMSNLSILEEQASTSVQGLVSGRGVDIHAAMIATQKSDLAFEMALAVRGKVVSAYQAMMGVQF